MEPQKQYIDKLAWIYLKDRKILSTRSKGKGAYYIPGGKRDGNETDIQALTREAKEELSVELISETIKKFGVFEAQAHGNAIWIVNPQTIASRDFSGGEATRLFEVLLTAGASAAHSWLELIAKLHKSSE